MTIPRLRMFAGPNGSGKSTLKAILNSHLLGVYVNPDEIEREIQATGSLNFGQWNIQFSPQEFCEFMQSSVLLKKVGLLEESAKIKHVQNQINFEHVSMNAYFASVLSDFLRQKLLASGQSFTFETVMSSEDKVKFLQKAQLNGYRSYLYFVATEDPQINISRVSHRVKMGGHSVPNEKIISRYSRSLDLLLPAIRFTDRAYIFDNSGSQQIWIAEITSGSTLELKSELIPHWFQSAILDKVSDSY